MRQWIKIQRPNASPELVRSTLRDLTAGYVGTTDSPANAYIEELAEIYPNAIVICSTRDSASWWKSAQELYKNTDLWWLDIMFFPMPTLRYFGQWRDTMAVRSVLDF